MSLVIARDILPGKTPNCWEPGSNAFLVRLHYWNDVYELPNDIALCLTRPWIYPVGCYAATSRWLVNPKTRQIEDDYLLKLLPEDIAEGIRNGHGWLFLYNSQEGIAGDNGLFTSLHTTLKCRGIPANKTIFATSNFWHDRLYQEWCDQNSITDRIHTANSDHWEYVVSDVARNRVNEFTSIDEYHTGRNDLREKYYLCYNRRVKSHRIAAGMYFQQHKLLDKGLVSFASPEVSEHGMKEFNFVSHPWWGGSKEELFMFTDSDKQKEFMKILPLFVDKQTMKINLASDHTSWPYQQSYFSVVNETLINDKSLFLSEKAYKPMLHYHPFILIGSQHTLRKLREDGYKTFDLDESYDEESDPFHRMMMALEQVRKLCDMPISKLNEWYWNQRDVLIHNRDHLGKRLNMVPEAYQRLSSIMGLD